MISNIKKTEGYGDNSFKKEIHKGSESIMFSVLQSSQYMYPVKSAVREVVSNGLDSIIERDNAIDVLNGKIKVSDLYSEKEGEEYVDSKFDRSYYDPKWLSKDNNATIIYIENDTETRDRIQVIDNGVGLGEDRLVKHFSLGFSHKRLSKGQTGFFGLGSKSLLSTGVDSYQLTTRHNGKEFSFEIFKDHIISTTDKFAEDGSINPEHTFYNGYKCHYKKTTELNQVIVEAEVKRYQKKEYESAVEEQLQYMDNVKFFIKDRLYNEEGTERDFKSRVLFQNESVIVGEQDYYAVPQILLKSGEDSTNYISYGVINWDALEMKKYRGNVSFIININDVDVTPSRESVIWNAKTRETIKGAFLKAQGVISDFIDKKLEAVDDIFGFVNLRNSLVGGTSNEPYLKELFKIVDASGLDSSYKGIPIHEITGELGESKNIALGMADTKGYATPIQLEDTKYESIIGSLIFSVIYKAMMGSSKEVFVYVGTTKYTKIAPYARERFSMSRDSNILTLFIHTDLFSRYGEDPTEENINNALLKEKHIIKFFILSIKKLIKERKIDLLLEGEIDKSKMRDMSDDNESTEKKEQMTEGQKAKLEGKTLVYSHSSFSYASQSYVTEATLKGYIDSRQPVIIYARGGYSSSLINDASYHSIDGNMHLLSCPAEAYKRFIKVKGVQTLGEACYIIKEGDIIMTSFGRKLFTRTAKMVKALGLKGYYQNDDTVLRRIVDDSRGINTDVELKRKRVANNV